MSSKRILVIAMGVVVTSCGLAVAHAPQATPAPEAQTAPAPSAEAGATPRLTIVEPVKDYGTISKGEKLDWSFAIKNTGDADLKIIAAKPGCGCTVADFDKVIKPGATGKVNAHVDTTAFSGPIAKTVTLETNDPNTPTSTLTIHAIVKPYVEAYPAGFVRFNMLQGDAQTEGVTLYSEEEDPFQITKIDSPDESVKATFEKISNPTDFAPGVGRPGQNQYKVNITVGGPDAKIGPLAEKVHIYTNSKHQPDYFVSVIGVIRPTYRVEPPVVNFGEVAPSDAAASRSVIVHSNDLKSPDRFEVTKAESSVSSVTTAVKPTSNKGEYEVTLQLAKNAKPGDVDGQVKIYTNDKVNPIVTIPVKGTVKSAAAASAKSGK